MSNERPWHVLLIGGASGVGKTHVSYRVAQHFGVGITEIDDFQVILEHMTTPEQQPVVHFFNTDPDAFMRLDEEEKLAFAIRYATVMAEPLEYVIANHLDGGPPIVLEGDFLLPSLAVRPAYDGISAAGRVQAFFIYEPDEDQVARNYLAREGEPQPERARASWRYSEWLRQEAGRLGLPTLAARPWETVFERALILLESNGDGDQRATSIGPSTP
jgi:2-phosphoglycerate kinase